MMHKNFSPFSLSETSSPEGASTVRVAIVGGGFAALMAYGVLRFRGLRRDEIRIYTPDGSPERSWERFIRAINLQSLRSESIAHFFPTDSPGLATVEAMHMWSLRPIVQSWFDRYHPTVDSFIRHTQTVARLTGFYHSLVPSSVGRMVRAQSGFDLFDVEGTPLVHAQHVILAIGHGKFRIPQPVTDYREQYGADGRVVLSFEEKQYAPPRTILVVGDGLTSGTEWANILQTGGTVLALSMNGFSFGQPLNTPRRYFSRRGIAPYRQQEETERLQELRSATRGTIPRYPHWVRLFDRAQRDGRLQLFQGELVAIEPLDGDILRCTIRLPESGALRTILANQLISAAGFHSPSTHPLLAQLIEDYELPTVDGVLKVTDDFCLSGISTARACAAVIGPAAAWGIPSADSLGGMKIVAHRIANLICGTERWTPWELAQKTARWTRLMAGKELA